MIDQFRGHNIEMKSGEFYYCDDGMPTAETWEDKPCGHCGKGLTKEGHDGCLRTLPNIMNACCGHGNINEAYIQYWDGSSIHGKDALKIIDKLKISK